MKLEEAYAAWMDEDAERLNAMAELAREYAVSLPEKNKSEDRAFCATGEGGGIDNSCGHADKIAQMAIKSISETGGFSIHPITTESPTSGYMVSVVPKAETILTSSEEITGERISQFMDENKSELESRPSLHIGGWIDSGSGNVYIDLSEQFDDLDDAIDAAESTNQLAIWDLNEKKEIRKDDYGSRRTRGKEETRSLRLPARGVGRGDREGDSRSPRSDHGGSEISEAAAALVRELTSAGAVDVPVIAARPASESRAMAEYDAESDTLYVSDALTGDTVAAFRLAASRGWVSQPNPLLHELAHRHHAIADADSYETSASFSFSDAQSRAVAESVSRYAATSGREFVAEVLAGMWAGSEYSDDVLRTLSDLTNGKMAT